MSVVFFLFSPLAWPWVVNASFVTSEQSNALSVGTTRPWGAATGLVPGFVYECEATAQFVVGAANGTALWTMAYDMIVVVDRPYFLVQPVYDQPGVYSGHVCHSPPVETSVANPHGSAAVFTTCESALTVTSTTVSADGVPTPCWLYQVPVSNYGPVTSGDCAIDWYNLVVANVTVKRYCCQDPCTQSSVAEPDTISYKLEGCACPARPSESWVVDNSDSQLYCIVSPNAVLAMVYATSCDADPASLPCTKYGGTLYTVNNGTMATVPAGYYACPRPAPEQCVDTVPGADWCTKISPAVNASAPNVTAPSPLDATTRATAVAALVTAVSSAVADTYGVCMCVTDERTWLPYGLFPTPNQTAARTPGRVFYPRPDNAQYLCLSPMTPLATLLNASSIDPVPGAGLVTRESTCSASCDWISTNLTLYGDIRLRFMCVRVISVPAQSPTIVYPGTMAVWPDVVDSLDCTMPGAQWVAAHTLVLMALSPQWQLTLNTLDANNNNNVVWTPWLNGTHGRVAESYCSLVLVPYATPLSMGETAEATWLLSSEVNVLLPGHLMPSIVDAAFLADVGTLDVPAFRQGFLFLFWDVMSSSFELDPQPCTGVFSVVVANVNLTLKKTMHTSNVGQPGCQGLSGCNLIVDGVACTAAPGCEYTASTTTSTTTTTTFVPPTLSPSHARGTIAVHNPAFPTEIATVLATMLCTILLIGLWSASRRFRKSIP